MPAREYVSACCNAPAHKPKAGQKEVAKDPESGKMKSGSKGLGKWRCDACGKSAKVSSRKPTGKEVITVVAPPAVMLVDVTSFPIAPPNVRVEVPIAKS